MQNDQHIQELPAQAHPNVVYALQVSLTWLDLSFNSITKLEGLSKLKKLTDLSLFSNKLERIENIETLEDLVVLSLGEQSTSHSVTVPHAGIHITHTHTRHATTLFVVSHSAACAIMPANPQQLPSLLL